MTTTDYSSHEAILSTMHHSDAVNDQQRQHPTSPEQTTNITDNTMIQSDHMESNVSAKTDDVTLGFDSNIDANNNTMQDNVNYQVIVHQDTDNHRTCQPQHGAVPVAGMNTLSTTRDTDVDNARPVRVEPAYLESSSGFHNLQYGKTMIRSMTLELKGFVPTVNEPKYLVPQENVQRPSSAAAEVATSFQDNVHTIDHHDLVNEPTESNGTTTEKATTLENPARSPNLITVDRQTTDTNDIVKCHHHNDKITEQPNAAMYVSDIKNLWNSKNNFINVNKQTEGESTSSDMKKDEEVKQTANFEPCHPVALITGEFVPYYPKNVQEQDEPHSPNNDGTRILPTTKFHHDDKIPEQPSAAVHVSVDRNLCKSKIHCISVNKQTEGECTSSEKKEDEEVKQRANLEPCHPVALITGEFVPYHPTNVQEQDEAHSPNNDGTQTSPTTTNTNYCIPRSGKKGRCNTTNDDNGIIPGAVQVNCMNRSVDDSSDESFNGDDDEVGQIARVENSFTLEIDGFVPTISGPKYLVPEENVQRIAHMYASVEPTNEHARTSHKDNDRDKHHRHFMRKYLNTICLLDMMIVLNISAIVVIAVCGMSICHRNSQESQNGQPYESNYKSFATKQELMDAIDRFLSSQNMSELEETYGSIAHWNVSHIQDFSYLFSPFGGERQLLNSKFNEDISRWDVSSATNMSFMFYGAQAFRGDISKWDVLRVTEMQYFMAEAYKFDGNLSQWDTSQCVNTSHMFYDCSTFTGIGLENWNVGRVYDMTSMFASPYECYLGDLIYCRENKRFNRNLSNWDISNVHFMASMFEQASSFLGVGIEYWDTSQVETTSYMFSGASSFDANLSKWNISNVHDTSGMFEDASSFQGVGIEDWDTSKVETMRNMFRWALSFDANLSKWNISNTRDIAWMFSSAISFQGVGVEDWNTSKVESMRGFTGGISFDANLSKWNVSNVKDTSLMFQYASSFKGVGIEYWDTSKVETMFRMFQNALSFDANLSSWDVANVDDMSYMFQGATSFRGVGLDIWNVSHLSHAEFMFESATAFHGNLSNWDVSNVENATAMFRNATSFAGAPWWNETSDTSITNEIS